VKNLIFVSFFLLIFCGCKFDDSKKKYTQPVRHLEYIFFSSNEYYDLDSLKNIYKDFWFDYTLGVVPLPDNLAFNDSLKKIRSFKPFQELIDEIQVRYSDFNVYEAELQHGLGNYMEFFPEKTAPKLVTIFGALNAPIIASDSVLAISLEMFLGKKYYQKWSYKYPPYMHHQFHPEYMTCLALESWLNTEFFLNSSNFLSHIIHYGKIKYVLHAMTQKEDHIIMGYTPSQILWCQEYEFEIWRELFSKGLLYSTDQFEILKYINPSPSTRGMPSESPGQLVKWVGWKIVDRFMKNNTDVSIQELMSINDAQYILQQSKYKP
jgi:hypothetical protein